MAVAPAACVYGVVTYATDILGPGGGRVILITNIWHEGWYNVMLQLYCACDRLPELSSPGTQNIPRENWCWVQWVGQPTVSWIPASLRFGTNSMKTRRKVFKVTISQASDD